MGRIYAGADHIGRKEPRGPFLAVSNPSLLVREMYRENRDVFLSSEDPEVRADKLEIMRACRENLGPLGILTYGVGEYAQRFMDFFSEDRQEV